MATWRFAPLSPAHGARGSGYSTPSAGGILPWSTTAAALARRFAPYGLIDRVQIAPASAGGDARVGFVEMPDRKRNKKVAINNTYTNYEKLKEG
jgi:hypothetical protein